MIDHARIHTVMGALRGLHLPTQADREFRAQLDRLCQRDGQGNVIPVPVRFGRTKETRGIMVIDGAGGGKTTLVSRCVERHPSFGPGPEGVPPWVSATVPSPPSLKAMMSSLLAETGYPFLSIRRTVWQMNEILRFRLAERGQTILIVDEAHDLLCREKDVILRAVKALMQGDGAVIVVLVGTNLLDDIVRSDPQVQRRFTTVRLADLSVAADGTQYRDVVIDLCNRAGLVPDVPGDLVPRLFLATRYRMGRAIEFIIDAIEQALLAGDTQLETWHFAVVWGLREGTDPARNVFLIPDWQKIDPDLLPGDRQGLRGRVTPGRRGGRSHG